MCLGKAAIDETVTVEKSSTVPRQAGRSSNWKSSSCRGQPPRPRHSISTTSLMHGRPVQDTNIYSDDHSIYRTQSKPELEKYQVLDGEAVYYTAVHTGSSHPSAESLTHGGQERDAGIGLQFMLMNMKTLEDQISCLRRHFASSSHQSSSLQYSSPVKAQVQSLLDNAKLHIVHSKGTLERVCDLIGAGRLASASEPPSPARSTPIREVEGGLLHPRSTLRRFSRSSSGGGGIPISRQSSGHSTKGGAAKFNPLSSVGMDAKKHLTFDHCKLCLKPA